jgi:hypothetical protein
MVDIVVTPQLQMLWTEWKYFIRVSDNTGDAISLSVIQKHDPQELWCLCDDGFIENMAGFEALDTNLMMSLRFNITVDDSLWGLTLKQVDCILNSIQLLVRTGWRRSEEEHPVLRQRSCNSRLRIFHGAEADFGVEYWITRRDGSL